MYGLSPLALSHERSGLGVEAPAPSFIAKPVKIQTPMSACDPNSIKKNSITPKAVVRAI